MKILLLTVVGVALLGCNRSNVAIEDFFTAEDRINEVYNTESVQEVEKALWRHLVYLESLDRNAFDRRFFETGYDIYYQLALTRLAMIAEARNEVALSRILFDKATFHQVRISRIGDWEERYQYGTEELKFTVDVIDRNRSVRWRTDLNYPVSESSIQRYEAWKNSE